MGRLLLAGALVVAIGGTASAGPTRKVYIETEPSGATVYLDDIDRGPACRETPCTINAPIGTSTIIIRLDRHDPEIAELDVPKGRSRLSQKYKLRSAIGTLVIDAPKGATIKLNQEERGRAPQRLDVPAAEPHHLIVTYDGKSLYDNIVEVETGQELEVKVKMPGVPRQVANTTDDDDEGDDDDGGDDGDDDDSSGETSGGSIGGSTDVASRSAYLTVGVAFDVGFRKFIYDTPMSTTMFRDLENEGGGVIAGPAVELFPGRLAKLKPLSGLSLYFRIQFPVAGPTVEDPSGELQGTVTTKWDSYEASLRQRWVFGGFGIEISPGFVQDRFTYDASVGSDIMLMPNTRYQSLRLGGKLLYAGANAEPYVSVENRIVMSGGSVEERADARMEDANITGLRGSVGLALKLGALTVRVEGTLQSYSWKFASRAGNDPAVQGASDSVRLISGLLTYSY